MVKTRKYGKDYAIFKKRPDDEKRIKMRRMQVKRRRTQAKRNTRWQRKATKFLIKQNDNEE